MIYNFLTYLEAQLPAYTYEVEGDSTDVGQERVLLIERSGDPGGLGKFEGAIVQVIVYNRNPKTAHDTAEAIYNLIRERFDVTLPAPALTGSTDLRVASIRALQRPYLFEMESSGVTVYGNNYQVTFHKP